MISFGTPAPLAHNGEIPLHLGARAFVPVFKRTKIEEVYKYPTGANFERVKKEFPRYDRWACNFFIIQPTSKRRFMWGVLRARRAHAGQLRLM